jgi:hypothetical protein
MPTVPRVQRQVRREALPGVRLTAAETATSQGAGLAEAQAQSSQAMAGFGATVANAGIGIVGAELQRERDRADQVSILAYQRKLGEWENKRVTEALQVQGKDAMTLPEDLAAEFAQITGELDKELTNDRQRAMAERLKTDRGLGIDLTMRRHVSKEMDRYEAEELKGFLSNSVNTAILNANDPKRVFAELGAAEAALRTHGKNTGMGPEAIERSVLALQTETHGGVIERLLANEQDKAAKVYFEEAKGAGQISGEAVANIEKALEEGALRGESQRQSDKIIASGGTLSEQRAAARAIEDPKLRDQVMQRIEHEATVKERETREMEDARFNSAYNTMEKAGGNIRAIPPAQRAAMSPGEKSAIRSESERITRGVPVKTDLPTYYGLMERAGDDPANFVTENLLRYRHLLDDTEFKQLTNIQASIKAGNREAASKQGLGDFLTNKEIVDNTLLQYGITPSGKDQTKEEQAATIQFQRTLQTLVSEEAARTNKKPDDKWIQQAADRILSQTITTQTPTMFGFSAYKYKTKPIVSLTIADVPSDQRKQIEAALKAKNMAVSDATILDLYVLSQIPRTRK